MKGILSRRPGERVLFGALLAVVLFGSLVLQLHRLGDAPLTVWDESFHAIVARNLVKHPLEPTLLDVPYLPYDYADWHANRVWMHKPILPLWTIAASFAAFGVDRFTLRLPSAMLSTACVLLTYLVGRRLVDRRAGLVAAAIQAALPAMVHLVRGSWFADHVDVSLLFWTELGVWFLLRAVESGRLFDVVAAGVATGCAYLSKSYLAAIIPGLAVVAWILPRLGAGDRATHRLAGRHVISLLGVAMLVIAPWTLWSFLRWPKEFAYEYAAWWHHLAGQWENWGAPWDRVLFDYLPLLNHVFYTPMIVATLALSVPAFRERSFGLLFPLAWAAGVFLPHLIAPTKTPTATLIAVPALLILVGALASRSLRGDLLSQAAWAGIAIAAVAHHALFRPPERGYPDDYGFGMIAAKNPWVLWQLGEALAGAVVFWIVGRFLESSEARARLCKGYRVALVVAALVATLWLLARAGRAAWKLTIPPPEASDYSDVGAFARRNLPANAALIVEGKWPYEHQLMMFHADRTSYARYAPEGGDRLQLASEIRRAGGEPYLVTTRVSPLPIVYESEPDGRTIYRLP